MLYQGRICRELRAGNAARIESFHIVGIHGEPVLFYRQRSLHQVFNLRLGLRTSWTMCRLDETIIGVFSSIQHSHSIQLMEQNSGEQVIYGEGVVRMPFQNLIELLDRAIIIKIVKMVECNQIQWVSRSE